MPIRRSSPPGRRLPGGLLTTALTWAPAKKAPAGPGLPGPRQGFKHYASDDFGQPSVVFFPLFVLQDPRDASRGLNEGTKVELKSLRLIYASPLSFGDEVLIEELCRTKSSLSSFDHGAGSHL